MEDAQTRRFLKQVGQGTQSVWEQKCFFRKSWNRQATGERCRWPKGDENSRVGDEDERERRSKRLSQSRNKRMRHKAPGGDNKAQRNEGGKS